MRQCGLEQKFLTFLGDYCEQHLNNYDKSFATCCVFLGLAKDFNSTNYNILIAKLLHYGICGIPLQLIRSSIIHRTQCINPFAYNSNSFVVKCRVPQGSVVWPLSFLM